MMRVSAKAVAALLFYSATPSYLDITKRVSICDEMWGAGAGDKFYLRLHVSFLRRNNKISLTFPFDVDLGIFLGGNLILCDSAGTL